MTFVPDRTANTAQVHVEPPLAGVQRAGQRAAGGGECGDYRGALRPISATRRASALRAATRPAASERTGPWPMPTRAVTPRARWRACGVAWAASWPARCATAMPCLPAGGPAFELQSPALAEVIRDINKYSNNVMAQQLFLTLSLQQKGTGTPAEGSRELLRQWWPASALAPPTCRSWTTARGCRASRASVPRRWRACCRGLGVAGHARADVLAAHHRRGRHDAAQPLTRRQRPPEDRQPARRGGRGRLCAGRQRPAPCAGGH
jgi:hypothetical protein